MIKKTVRTTTRTDYGHGGAIRRAGEVRASAPICALLAVIAALLAVHFMPVNAYADSISAQIISGPSAVPFADMYGASIAAPDRYVAAALLLGYGPDAVSGWDDDVKAKLSNEQTGGRFYTFAQNSVQNYFDVTENTGIFKTYFDYVGGAFWNTAQALYGNNLWSALYTSEELSGAASDLSTILSGGNIGGGGGGGSGNTSIPDVLSFTMADFVSSDNRKLWYQSGDYTTLNATINVNASRVVSDFSAYADSYPYHYYFAWQNGNYLARGGITLDVYFSDTPCEIRSQDGFYLVGNYKHRQYETAHLYVNGVNDVGITYASSFDSASRPDMSNVLAFNRVVYAISNQSGGSEPVVPPSNWPDEPSAPSPPELPEPGTNPTVTPTPWSPVISPTFDFDLNITTEPTSNDLIDWVKKIYYELRSFHSDAHDWFDDVGKGIDGVVKALNDAQKQIYDELQTIDSTIRDEGQKIRDYMYRMFHWLKDQLNFQNDSFNDSNIVYWLKRIWSKLGNGDVNVRPTDPTVDPPAWWEWLNKMLDSLLDGLVGVFNELLGGTGDLLEEVIHQFPFSIPWDIAAYLTALAAPPVTPVFDIVIPAVDGWWSQFTFHIDMSPYDTAAATVRLMTKLVFAGLLAWKSRELLNMMDVTKW